MILGFWGVCVRTELYVTFCDPMGCVCVCVCARVRARAWALTLIWLFATPWTVAHQVPLSMEFSRQEYWSGLPFPPPGDFSGPTQVSNPCLLHLLCLLHLHVDFFTAAPPGKLQGLLRGQIYNQFLNMSDELFGALSISLCRSPSPAFWSFQASSFLYQKVRWASYFQIHPLDT